MRFLLTFFLLSCSLFASSAPYSRCEQIPVHHVEDMSDEYLTGYVQALVDMHYYEFQVQTVVVGGTVYVFNLPNNELFRYSILRFIQDIPCICYVEAICGCKEDFLCALAECDPDAANRLAQCISTPPCCYQVIWLPQNTVLFQPLIADPRQVINSAAFRLNDNVIGKHVGAVSFGGDFIIVRLKDVLWWRGDMDLGVQAGIFSVFDLDHVEACMVNTDFFVAAMATYAFDRWSFRARWWHLSCHLGDEFLICNPDYDRRNLSDEGIDLFASYQMGHAVRIYGGIGYIYSRDKEFPEDPLYFEAGTEIRVFGIGNRCTRLYTQPFLAMHFRSWEEHDFDIDQTYALGVEWSPLLGVGRKLRIFLEYHNGYSKEGQFVRERSDYLAAKLEYGF